MKHKIPPHTIPDDKWHRIIGIPLVGFALTLFFDTTANKSIELFILKGSICTLYTFCIWSANRYVFVYARIIFSSINQTRQRIILQFTSGIAVTVLVSFLLTVIQMQLIPIKLSLWKCVMIHLNYSIFTTVLILTIYESVYFFRKWNDSIQETERLRQENLRSQLESLKHQVNPHFLFNSLNTLISVIDEDPEIAKNYVQQLSNVYRYILQAKDKTLNTLEEELGFLESYIYLLKIRYGENLQFNITVPDTYLGTKIPPLTLQILAENAIKHNIISASKPLTVEIYIENQVRLIIRNNLQIKTIQVESDKTGLINICERYKLSSAGEVEIVQNDQYFSVSLPLFYNS